MIRQLVVNDCKEFYKIRLLALELHPEAFGTGAEAWSAATDEQVQALLQTNDREEFVLGAFENNELIGAIGLKREKKNSVRHKGTVWGLIVHPDFRSNGLGSALVTALIEKAKFQDDLEYVRAVVTNTTANAIDIFASQGFAKYGVEPRGIKQGTTFYDQTYLALHLRRDQHQVQ